MIGFWIVIIIVIVLVWAVVSTAKAESGSNSSKQNSFKKKPVLKMLNREGDLHEDEWHTYIAGVKYHAYKYDIGGFYGWVGPDKDNLHDNKAMGIYASFDSKGKLLGYIPAKELSDYREWCDAQPQPCVGFIFVEDGEMRGRVKILRPCSEEFLEKEFSRYLQWFKDNFGTKYVPKSKNMQFEIEL